MQNNNNKDLVAMMDEQLKRLTKDLVQQQQQKQRKEQVPPPPAIEPCEMESLWDYLDTLERVDLDPDEHLAAPVYFTGREMEQQSKPTTKRDPTSSSPSKKVSPSTPAHGFLPSAFNSICSLVVNVLRLPSLIMSTWQDEPSLETQHQYNNIDRSSHHAREQHLFFDVDDIDFLPETAPPVTKTTTHGDNNDLSYDAMDGGPCQYEAFFLDVHDDDAEHYSNHNQFDKRPSYETKQSADDCVVVQNQKLVVDPLAANAGETDTTAAKAPPSPLPLPPTSNKPMVVGQLDNNANQNATGIVERTVKVVVPEETKYNSRAAVTAIDQHHHQINHQQQQLPVTRNQSNAVDIVKVSNASGGGKVPSDPSACTRRFISTPDQECSRMAVIGVRRKRQAPIKMALVSRSTPIAMKSNGSTGSCYRPQPRTLYHQSKRTLHKNRKEKRRHEIAANIHEDYDLSSEESEVGNSNGCAFAMTDDTEDDDLLPLTARNLTEPSCLMELFGAESSMNSSTGSVGRSGSGLLSSSVGRRNSINFQSSVAYERGEFPVIGNHEGEEDKEVSPLPHLMVTKPSGVYFEIPNSPQRRMLMPAKMKPLKVRTSSVMSSSVGSSPATSFDAGGKFWGGQKSNRRVRTVSEGSEDDLIEFVCEAGTDYLADVFSDEEEGDDDDDDDEDYSSEEEDEEENEEDEGETETESESDVVDCHQSRSRVLCVELRAKAWYGAVSSICRGGDLPDSGVEEKKVSEMWIFVFILTFVDSRVNFDLIVIRSEKIYFYFIGFELWYLIAT